SCRPNAGDGRRARPSLLMLSDARPHRWPRQLSSADFGSENIYLFDHRRFRQKPLGICEQSSSNRSVQMGNATFLVIKTIENSERRSVELDRKPRFGFRLLTGQRKRAF